MCPYCANTQRIKREHGGYCVKYSCYERLKQDKLSRERHTFNQHALVCKVKTVKTIEVYRYGKLVETRVEYS